MSLDFSLSSIKLCDPSWLYFVYIHYQGLRAQLKINAPSVLNDNRIKRKKRERKDDMPKKHDPINKKRVSQEKST